MSFAFADETSEPRPNRRPPPAPHGSADDVSRIWQAPPSVGPLLVEATIAGSSRQHTLLVSPPRYGLAADRDDAFDVSQLTPLGPPSRAAAGGAGHGINDSAAVQAGRRRFGFAPVSSLADAAMLQPPAVPTRGRLNSPPRQSSQFHSQASTAAPSGSGSRAAGHKLELGQDTAEQAAKARVEELIRRTTEHQNAHVKLRAQLTLDVDRARWESDQADFRLAELQAQLEGFLQALRQRIKSRLDTAAQLRVDTEQQIASILRGELRSLLAGHNRTEQHELQRRVDAVETLAAMREQLTTHVDVQVTALQHDLASQGDHDPTARLAATKQAVVSAARIEKDSIDAIGAMMADFASQARAQLLELRAEREHFEKRFMIRIQEISRIDSRRAPVVADSSIRIGEGGAAQAARPAPSQLDGAATR
jgi:hypothetical protein